VLLEKGAQPVPGYTLDRYLGMGAMGVVWVARTDDAFEAAKALKFIDVTDRGGSKEYRALKTVKEKGLIHPNLLKLINYWLKDNEGRLISREEEPDDTLIPSGLSGPSEAQPAILPLPVSRPTGTTQTNGLVGTRAEVSTADHAQKS